MTELNAVSELARAALVSDSFGCLNDSFHDFWFRQLVKKRLQRDEHTVGLLNQFSGIIRFGHVAPPLDGQHCISGGVA